MPGREPQLEASEAEAAAGETPEHGPARAPELASLLAPARVAVDVQVSSKKRLLEELAALLLKESPSLDRSTVFQILIGRERLGSTGIGAGVALPHGRLNGIDEAIAAVVRLKRPLDFDAIDQQPVSLVFGLLVPAEATESHLNLLAVLARMFSDAQLREKLMNAADARALYDHIVDWAQGTDSDP